ncbi:MAG: primosomal protein N' [bacterium]|nr:primosomal protein N' [bacterium]
MPEQKQSAEIAVPGPVRRTFSYSIPSGNESLQPGCRIIVPFGNRKLVGFFIRLAPPPSDIKLKNISQILDQTSLFNKELFDFLLWMSDYYFANPYDCLAAALPPLLKKAMTPEYSWSGNAYRLVEQKFKRLPRDIGALVRPGQKLSTSDLKLLRTSGASLFRRIVSSGLLQLNWPEPNWGSKQKLVGYRATTDSDWDDFFARRRNCLPIFDGLKRRSELIEAGWGDHTIREACKAGLLTDEYSDSPATLLQFIEAKEAVKELELNQEQSAAFNKIRNGLDDGFGTTLLHGVTGSGKTLVYCHLCREIIKRDRTALVLTPEIALTGSMLSYFRSFFGDEVAVIHSSMTDRERYESWKGISEGRYRVAIGPRSALFAPIQKPGIIIVDEEHDGSYKQDDPSPRFHGRDAAIMRAKLANIPILLGSASPSFESYHNSREGRYQLISIRNRPSGAKLPAVNLVDMRRDRLGGDLSYFSHQLKQATDKRNQQNEQVILFLNRRGFAPSIQCGECGHVPSCPQCQVTLTFHKVGKRLSCHYCGHVDRSYDRCEKCLKTYLIFRGVGTQKVEENLPRLFKDISVLRMDSDVVFGRRKAYDILQSFASKEATILLGTQMVTKGLDLPEVTLVGVLSGDAGLDLPDFRSKEKAFARLLQVSGRCGRADKPGEVLIQTFNPEDELITDAARQDYDTFFDREIENRRALSYPPFSRIVNFILSSENEEALATAMRKFHQDLLHQIEIAKVSVTLLGPAECPLYYLRKQFRRHLFVKTKQPTKLTRMLTKWETAQPRFGLPASIKIVIDVDPDSMM